MSSIPSVAAISAFQQEQTLSQVSMAVARKSLDAARAQGEAAISLLDAAVQMQQQIANRAEPGKGTCVDVVG
ncbi:MAG: hypothetical protein IT445_19145 [Phycisphaeraceae bacterium]|nr:hypothetical protein [Phycisphaeraceae bacterium]